MIIVKLNWHIKNYDSKRAIGDRFRRKVFLVYLNGKKHYSIGKCSKYFDELPPKNDASPQQAAGYHTEGHCL
jgi:hypothetical protein